MATAADLQVELGAILERFEREQMQVTPSKTTVAIVDNLLIAHLKDILSQAEKTLAATRDGQVLMQQFNEMLFAHVWEELKMRAEQQLQRRVVDVQTTLSPQSGSIVAVFTLEDELV